MFRRWSLRTLLIVVAVIAVGLAILNQFTIVESNISQWLSHNRDVPQRFYEQTPESLLRFEQDLESWFLRHGYERTDFRKTRHRYRFRRPDSKTSHREILVDLDGGSYGQPLSIDLKVHGMRRIWEPIPWSNGRPTAMEINLAKELVKWLDARIGPLPHRTY